MWYKNLCPFGCFNHHCTQVSGKVNRSVPPKSRFNNCPGTLQDPWRICLCQGQICWLWGWKLNGRQYRQEGSRSYRWQALHIYSHQNCCWGLHYRYAGSLFGLHYWQMQLRLSEIEGLVLSSCWCCWLLGWELPRNLFWICQWRSTILSGEGGSSFMFILLWGIERCYLCCWLCLALQLSRGNL